MLVVSLLILILVVGLCLFCFVDPAKYPNAKELGRIMFFCALLAICFDLRALALSLR